VLNRTSLNANHVKMFQIPILDQRLHKRGEPYACSTRLRMDKAVVEVLDARNTPLAARSYFLSVRATKDDISCKMRCCVHRD